MPEVGIGFFPDVGATYLLPRLPHRIGVAMAVTGVRATGADMAALGLANAYVQSRALPSLAAALEQSGDTDAIVSEFAAAAPLAPLLEHASVIGVAFAIPELDRILSELNASKSEFESKLQGMLLTKSPTSIAIALRQMQIGGDLTFEDAMRVEFRIVSRICRGHDFYEGVRATLVDKDNRPQWRPAAGERPDPADIDAYFAPLGANELNIRGETR
jgi:enoyl-CoA hydratase